jgi:cysteine desulfurase family protein (TIGR01976 family)
MFDPNAVRPLFPSLAREVAGRPAVFTDGPAGTQVPTPVIDAMADHLRCGTANHGGGFVTSEESDALTADARQAVADLMRARSDEIVFGQNMTSLTFAMSRAIARTWNPGDEVIVTRLDHDANITPWVMAADDRGANVRWVDFDPADGLDYDGLEELLTDRTRLVAVTAASNALGLRVDVARVATMAHAAGAFVYVDAVHYTPHDIVDVQAAGADFLAASAYKFYGPHTGLLFGKREHLERFEAYKVRPAPADPPGKWETGTQSFESLAGVTATVDYLASLGAGSTRRERIVTATAAIGEHESRLADRFVAGIEAIPGITLYGPGADPAARVPTFSIGIDGVPAAAAQRALGAEGIFTWAGHYYAVAVMERLGVLDSGGLLRIGFVHYNTADEVDRVLTSLERLASAR